MSSNPNTAKNKTEQKTPEKHKWNCHNLRTVCIALLNVLLTVLTGIPILTSYMIVHRISSSDSTSLLWFTFLFLS
jgi:hypothetical protein